MDAEKAKKEHVKYIASVIRALVTSRKPPIELRSVLRDYKDVEGEHLPYRKYGYSSPVMLLEDSGQFSIRFENGAYYITANFNEKTEHIASMVRNQRKPKGIKPPLLKRPLPLRSGGRYDQSWNKSTYSSNVYGRMYTNSYSRPVSNNISITRELSELRTKCAQLITEKNKYIKENEAILKQQKEFEIQRKKYESEIAQRDKELRELQITQKTHNAENLEKLNEKKKAVDKEAEAQLQELEKKKQGADPKQKKELLEAEIEYKGRECGKVGELQKTEQIEKERANAKEQEKVKEKEDGEKEREREKVEEREKLREREKDRERERDQVREREQDRERERERFREREKDTQRAIDREREQDRDRARVREREREKDTQRALDREREKNREREKDLEREKVRETEKDRERERERDRERSKDSERDLKSKRQLENDCAKTKDLRSIIDAKKESWREMQKKSANCEDITLKEAFARVEASYLCAMASKNNSNSDNGKPYDLRDHLNAIKEQKAQMGKAGSGNDQQKQQLATDIQDGTSSSSTRIEAKLSPRMRQQYVQPKPLRPILGQNNANTQSNVRRREESKYTNVAPWANGIKRPFGSSVKTKIDVNAINPRMQTSSVQDRLKIYANASLASNLYSNTNSNNNNNSNISNNNINNNDNNSLDKHKLPLTPPATPQIEHHQKHDLQKQKQEAKEQQQRKDQRQQDQQQPLLRSQQQMKQKLTQEPLLELKEQQGQHMKQLPVEEPGKPKALQPLQQKQQQENKQQQIKPQAMKEPQPLAQGQMKQQPVQRQAKEQDNQQIEKQQEQHEKKSTKEQNAEDQGAKSDEPTRRLVDIDVKNYMPFKFNDEFDALVNLEQYCISRRLDPPDYKFFGTNQRYSCRVTVANAAYSTYPVDYTNSILAKENCAKVAIEKLVEFEKRRRLPIASLTYDEIFKVLHRNLSAHPTGLVHTKIEDWFEYKYKERLPDDWYVHVCKCKDFIVDESAGIIFIKPQSTKVSSPPLSPTTAQMINAQTVPLIRLPWESADGWSVLITYCVSTVVVWGRLFGKEYHERYDKMVEQMEDYMKLNLVRPPSIKEQQTYCIFNLDTWHRVRVEHIDELKKTAYCFFVDFGDADTFNMSDLYVCPPTAMTIPAQAICFSLYGLEDFAENPHAYNAINYLSCKTVVGKICTNEEDFKANGGHAQGQPLKASSNKYGERHAFIQAVFYDTSSPQDDINLNELLLQRICEETVGPALKLENKSNPVRIAHISDLGDIYVLLTSADVKYVQHLITQIVESKFKRETHQVSYEDLQRDTLFLICDDTSEPKSEAQWYRGILTEKPHSKSDESFEIYYVDNGCKRYTHKSKIYRLESLSMALSKFPAQAIRVRLNGIPPIEESIVVRMRTLVKINSEALIKVVKHDADNVPMVTLYTRGVDGLFFAVNDTIQIEHELEGSKNEAQAVDVVSKTDPPPVVKEADSVSKSPEKIVANNALTAVVATKVSPPPATRVAALNVIPNFEVIPTIGAFFEVRVSYAANPNLFAVQPYKDFGTLKKLFDELQTYFANKVNRRAPETATVGRAYAAMGPDGLYYRVVIFRIFGDMLHVSYVDCGDASVIGKHQIFVLPIEMCTLPKMAVNAILHGMKGVSVGWTMDDCKRFRELTLAKNFIGIVHKVTYTNDGMDALTIPLLQLELIDTTTDVDVRIHEIFIKEQRALPFSEKSVED